MKKEKVGSFRNGFGLMDMIENEIGSNYMWTNNHNANT